MKIYQTEVSNLCNLEAQHSRQQTWNTCDVGAVTQEGPLPNTSIMLARRAASAARS